MREQVGDHKKNPGKTTNTSTSRLSHFGTVDIQYDVLQLTAGAGFRASRSGASFALLRVGAHFNDTDQFVTGR